jgi:hypothetical protein
MSGQTNPYVRVYYSVSTDPRFENVYCHPTILGTWLQLLIPADAAYPGLAWLPAIVHRASLKVLTDAGLVELVSGGQYRIHGLTAERERRATNARASANARYANAERTQSERSQSAVESHLLAETSRDETIQAEPSLAVEPHIDAYQKATGRLNPQYLPFLDSLADQYGQENTAQAIGRALSEGGREHLLSRAKDILVLQARELDRAEIADEKRRNAAKRAPLTPAKDLSPEDQIRAEAAFMAMRETAKKIGLTK